MPTVQERLLHVELKVNRAKEHVAELQREIERFFAANPYAVATKRDPKTRQLIYYVSGVKPTPQCLPLIVGDIIQNLMSALDHLAYQLICSDTADKPPRPRKIYFPIFDSVTEYEAGKQSKILGAAQDTVNAIDAIKPYKGGNDLLWMLHALNNIEKHRLLLTVGSYAGGVDFARHGFKNLAALIANDPKCPPGAKEGMLAAMEKIGPVFFRGEDTGFPLREGFHLFIVGPDEGKRPVWAPSRGR